MRLRLPVILICLCTAGWGGIALSDEPKHPCPPGRQCGVVGGILPPNAKSVTTERPAWAWTLDERLKIRCDRALAQARLDDAHDRVRARGLSVPAGSRTVDVISGHRHPELFLPHELFETFVMDGVIDPNGRRVFSLMLKGAGFRPDFQTQIEALSGEFIQDILEKRRLQSDQSAVGRIESKLCRDRALALSTARSRFGPALDRFLYEQVAPGLSEKLDEYSDSQLLKWREEGCQ